MQKKQVNLSRFLTVGALSAGALLGTMSIADAQPDGGGGGRGGRGGRGGFGGRGGGGAWQIMPRAERERLQTLTPAEREAAIQQWQARWQAMTPAERGAALEAAREEEKANWIRQTLTAARYTDVELQNAVVEFMQAQEKARVPLRAAAFNLTPRIIDPAATDEQLKTDLAAFRDAVTKDQERYKTELAALDAKVKFSTQPRLETLLTVLGVIGQEAPTLGGVGAIFPDSPMGNRGQFGPGGPGGRGGRGGGQGGPGGGPGGGGPGGGGQFGPGGG